MVVVDYDPYSFEWFSNMSRKEKTTCLTEYTLHKIPLWDKNTIGIPEINICRGQNFRQLRIDVLAITKGKKLLTAYEIKSCIEDFRSDKKWEQYLEIVHCLYFVFDEETFNKHEKEIKKKIDGKAGIIVFDRFGELNNRIHSTVFTDNQVEWEFFNWILFKMATRYKPNKRTVARKPTWEEALAHLEENEND